MKRLSELSHDTILAVDSEPYGCDPEVISVENIIKDRLYEDEGTRFSLTEKEVFTFDLEEILERICEEGYEDMYDDVKDQVFSAPETEPFLKMIKRVFESLPVYYMGADVLNDFIRR